MPRKKATPVQASELKLGSKEKAQPVRKLAPQIVSQNGQALTMSTVHNMIEAALSRQASQFKTTVDDDPVPGSIKSKSLLVTKAAASTPVTDAMNNLQNAVAEAHASMTMLIDLVEPHLPRHLFSDKDDGQATGMPSRVCYSENNSTTVNDINNQTNEVDRLATRIAYLRNNLIV